MPILPPRSRPSGSPPSPSIPLITVYRCCHRRDPRQRFPIECAIAARGAEMALERGDDGARHIVEHAGLRHLIADRGEASLCCRGILRDVARLGTKIGPNPDAGLGEARPVEELAGILLALRRYVGMAEDEFW